MSGAESANISLYDFDLPNDIDRLKRISKVVNSKKDPRFKKLIRSMIKAGAPEYSKLALWVSYLKEKNYQVNIKELKELYYH
ncbi:hypothetical protein AY601_2951 [Pedobacter cryoconitis]|uniref:Uncharacterized protein n=1 Tax=Pedobacter cryoconitis TaxID=188932 RepID=A0A127VES5_9SPHI|nr:hypothetical protein [Pedobacter cryoconitis]AMP99825.1 hypothetical protein AY601_2951 [Pedobacter cryoconitis]